MKELTYRHVFIFLTLLSEELGLFFPFTERLKVYQSYLKNNIHGTTPFEKSTLKLMLPKNILNKVNESDLKDFQDKYCLSIIRNDWKYDFVIFLKPDDFFTVLKLRGIV